MKKLFKKTTALLLTLVLLLSIAPMSVSAINAWGATLNAEETLPYLTYEIVDGEVTITGCTELVTKEITIPATIEGYPVTAIADSAFADNDAKFKKVNFNEGLKSIGKNAFFSCGLESLVIPDSVTSIAKDAFWLNNNIKTVQFGTGLKEINDIFSGNDVMESITIPDNVEYIDSSLFSMFSALKTVNIGSGLKDTIGSAFHPCDALQEINVDPDNEYLCSVDGVLFSKDMKRLIAYPAGREDEIYTTPETVEIIGMDAFRSSLVIEVIFPEGLKEIQQAAFHNGALVSVELPSSVKTVKEYAFAYNELEHLDLGLGVESVEKSAFWSSIMFKDRDLNIPASLKEIGDSAFGGENSDRIFKYLTVSPYNQNYSSENNVLFNKDKTKIIQFPCYNSDKYGNYVDTYTIPDGVTTVAEWAFYEGCKVEHIIMGKDLKTIEPRAFAENNYILTVEFNYGLEYIGEDAFYSCNLIDSFELPDTVTFVGQDAFRSVNVAKRIVLSQGMTSVEKSTFAQAMSLEEIVIPASITTIDSYAFSKCFSLRVVYYTGTQEQWESIVIKEGNEYLTNCKMHFESVIPHTHTEGEWEITTEPTCTRYGEKCVKCITCGFIVERESIDPLGHTEGEWKVTTEPSCTEKGEESLYCATCNEVLYTRELNANGHTEGEWVVTTEPNCTEKGEGALNCTECNELLKTREIKANGHTMGEWVITKYPSYNQNGEMRLYCSICNELIQTKIIDKVISKVTGVDLGDVALNYKNTLTLKPNVSVEGYPEYTVSYSVADNSVVSVDANGEVTALNRGTTEITVTVTDANGNIYQDTCKVEVKFTFWQWIINILLFGWIWY